MFYLIVVSVFFAAAPVLQSAELLIDHTCTDIYQVPTNWIEQAKQSLRIVYGHRSHGAQLTDGMRALIDFMANKGYSPCLYAWTHDGNTCSDALSLPETPYPIAVDLGFPDYTTWEQLTRAYLATNPQINVVMWSWSSELATNSTGTNVDRYLSLMQGLRKDYPNITFVYMTGCLDGGGTNGDTNLRNTQIRDHCLTNGLVLYDFADIESYDPAALTNFMVLRATDNCDYAPDGIGDRSRNWAIDWETNHVLGVDWFDCFAAHSQPLNGNRKAYSAWWLFARLAGWPGPLPALQIQIDQLGLPTLTYVQPTNAPAGSYTLQYSHDFLVWSNVLPQMIRSQEQSVTGSDVTITTHLNGDALLRGIFYRLQVKSN